MCFLSSGRTWINGGEAGQVAMLCDASIHHLIVAFLQFFPSYLGVYRLTTSPPTMLCFGESDVTSGGAVGGQNGLALLVVNDAEAHCAAPWKRTLLQRHYSQFAVTTGAATALSSSTDRRCVGVCITSCIRASLRPELSQRRYGYPLASFSFWG